MNELNDIVETLKNENAGLKEKIKIVESEHNREIEETRKRDKKSDKKKRHPRTKHSDSLESFLDFPVDSVAAELQKVISGLQEENQKLNSTVVRKDAVIDRLKEDIEKIQVNLDKRSLVYT